MEEKKERSQQRKKYAKAGTRTQKMLSFLLDNDLRDWVNKQTNKGRYLNNLIRQHMMSSKLDRLEYKPDEDEWPSMREDYEV